MRSLTFLALPILRFAAFALSIPISPAPHLSVNIGVEPDCPYGYYDFSPYNCAPYGYYGPEWFPTPRRLPESQALALGSTAPTNFATATLITVSTRITWLRGSRSRARRQSL